MMIEQSEKVLDIGVWRGGDYIKKDSPLTLRIGLDIDQCALDLVKAEYNLPVVRADASGEQFCLPFQENTFSHIDILFPFGKLLYGLCNSISLWKEFYRILTINGNITILCDRPNNGIIGLQLDGKNTYIEEPQDKIFHLCKKNDFLIEESIVLDTSQIKEYGSQFSNFALDWDACIYRVQIKKDLNNVKK